MAIVLVEEVGNVGEIFVGVVVVNVMGEVLVIG